jgi:AraC-like DNA-binding protein
MMPQMDGLELCRRVRQSDVLNHIPIIVISAKDADSDRMEAFQAGADAYLIKPFNAEELTLRVEQLLRQRQLLRQKFASGLPADNDYTGLKEGERQFLERLTALVESQLSNRELNTEMLADGMKMTRAQLNSKTRAVTGNTANNYIARIRMDRAARMLKQTDMNIGEVAMKCGFEDVSYFSRVFKQAFDCTPSQYRKLA